MTLSAPIFTQGFQKLSSKLFTYSKDPSGFGGSFVIERSTLDANSGLKAVNCAVGFIMISEKTKLEAEFRLTHIEYDHEGDILFWLFAPTFRSYNQSGGSNLQHVNVKVFNT